MQKKQQTKTNKKTNQTILVLRKKNKKTKTKQCKGVRDSGLDFWDRPERTNIYIIYSLSLSWSWNVCRQWMHLVVVKWAKYSTIIYFTTQYMRKSKALTYSQNEWSGNIVGKTLITNENANNKLLSPPIQEKWAVTVVPIYTRKTYTYIVKLDNSDFPKNSRKLLTHATISMVSSVSCSS